MTQTNSPNPWPPSDQPPPVAPGTYGSPGVQRPQVSQGRGRAVASLVLGIVGMLAWLLPCMGLPITIVGLVLGILDRKGPGRSMAIAGIILCCIGLAATLVNAGYGAYLGFSGQLFHARR